MGYVVLKINKMEKETPRLPNSLLAQSHNTSLLPPKTFVRIFKMCLNVCLYLESLHAYKNGLIAEFAYMTADLKLLHNHCLQFLLVSTRMKMSQAKSKTMPMQIFGG